MLYATGLFVVAAAEDDENKDRYRGKDVVKNVEIWNMALGTDDLRGNARFLGRFRVPLVHFGEKVTVNTRVFAS